MDMGVWSFIFYFFLLFTFYYFYYLYYYCITVCISDSFEMQQWKLLAV